MTEPTVWHDGLAELDAIPETVAERPCPACGAACSFIPVRVVGAGTGISFATSAELVRLQDVVLASLPLDVGEFDGHRTVFTDYDGYCSPSVAPIECSSCGAESLAVVSYGEVQPARWRLVVDGLVPSTRP